MDDKTQVVGIIAVLAILVLGGAFLVATVNNRMDNAAVVEMVKAGANPKDAACAVHRQADFCQKIK